MTESKKIEVVVKLPLNHSAEDKAKMIVLIASEILAKRDPKIPIESKMTFSHQDYDGINVAEFRTFINSDMSRQELTDVILKITNWLR